MLREQFFDINYKFHGNCNPSTTLSTFGFINETTKRVYDFHSESIHSFSRKSVNFRPMKCKAITDGKMFERLIVLKGGKMSHSRMSHRAKKPADNNASWQG